MSGHSKWAQIKRQKHVTDVKKGKVYGRFSKEISIAVRLGGEDPNYNFRLRNSIERAKTLGVPNEVINRAIKGSKDLNNNLEEILYEGYGIGGVAILVEATTDNRNRTAAELRTAFKKGNGNLGESGCVSWNFKKAAIIYVPIKNDAKTNKNNREELEEKLISFEKIDDILSEDDEENILVICSPENLETLSLSLNNSKILHSSELAYIPNTKIELKTEEDIQALGDLIEGLETLEDVTQVFHNAA